MRQKRMMARAGMALLAAGLLVGCTHPGPQPGGPGHGPGRPDKPGHGGRDRALETYKGYNSEVYRDAAKWRCRPDTHDPVCDDNLDITVVNPDGSTEIRKRKPATNSKIDCFYVYPTVSRDTTPNSDFTPGTNEEDLAIRYQAAQIGTQCRLYAPIYRQVTLSALAPPPTTPATTTPATTTTTTMPTPPGPPADAREIAYADVLDAFKHYIANDNKGRGFVIMGHSQGTANLARLLHAEIEPNPELRAHLVSALLIGGSPALTSGENDIKACTRAEQTGCVVSFASYREGSGPSGPLANPDATCTNPAALTTGAKTVLHPVFNANRSNPFRPGDAPPWASAGAATTITTDFVTTPGLVSGECVKGEASYFAVSVNADPADARTDDITGDLGGGNLHLMDVSLTSGDLQEIVRTQAREYGKRR